MWDYFLVHIIVIITKIIRDDVTQISNFSGHI